MFFDLETARRKIESGYPIARSDWDKKFIFLMRGFKIGEMLIPTMQTIPEEVKRVLIALRRSLFVGARFVLVDYADGCVLTAWEPSRSDIRADDYYIYTG